jgi:hypothetical protein
MKSIFTGTLIALLVITLFTSCTKTEQTGSIRSIEKFYAAATIDGNKVEFTENKNGFLNGYGKAGVFVEGMNQYFERQSSTYAQNGENIFNIYFMKWLNTSPPSKEDVRSIFYEGNYSFGSSDFRNLIEGVEIKYIDEAGIEWTTQGNQTGSYFEITSHSKNSIDSYTPYATSGKFSCKLYNSLGQVKTVTDGAFKGRTVVYY